MQTLTDLSLATVMEMDEKILDTQTEEYYTFGESVSPWFWCVSGRGHGCLVAQMLSSPKVWPTKLFPLSLWL